MILVTYNVFKIFSSVVGLTLNKRWWCPLWLLVTTESFPSQEHFTKSPLTSINLVWDEYFSQVLISGMSSKYVGGKKKVYTKTDPEPWLATPLLLYTINDFPGGYHGDFQYKSRVSLNTFDVDRDGCFDKPCVHSETVSIVSLQVVDGCHSLSRILNAVPFSWSMLSLRGTPLHLIRKAPAFFCFRLLVAQRRSQFTTDISPTWVFSSS